GVGAWNVPNPRKYGDRDGAARSILDEFTSWGFNAVGEKTFGILEPISSCADCKRLPEIQTFEINGGAMFDRFGVAPSFRSNKSITWGNNNRGGPWYWKALNDAFDSVNFGGYLHACYANNTCIPSAYLSDPYVVGLMSGDTDFFQGVS